ncbi:MAG: ATP-binding protein [Nitriliruptoraceae bacterium]|nr:ATP-binding protein [Nitriliruptoraceae bacterium]
MTGAGLAEDAGRHAPDAVALRGRGPRFEQAHAELAPALDGVARLIACHDAWPQEPFAVGVVVHDADTSRIDWGHGATHGWRGVLVTDAPGHDDLRDALDLGVLRSVIRAPWTPGSLAAQIRAQLSRRLRSGAPDHPSLGQLDRGERWLELPRAPLLRDLEQDDREIVDRLVRAVDRALGRRPRLSLPAGTRLTQQGVGVDAVLVVLAGAVGLDRSTEDPQLGELRLHHASTGPVIGLLALTQQRQAFFTARATTALTAIHLSIEQLDLALEREPEVTAALAALTVRALAGRLRRAEQLQVDAVRLNRELDHERRTLRETLRELESARLDLVESARMATLGELSAGIAHELNNPVAALNRSLAHAVDDVAEVVEGHPDAAPIRQVLTRMREAAPRSTAEDRARRRAFEARGIPADRARALVAAGLVPDAVSDGELTHPAQLDRLVAAARLGTALRDVELAGSRIADLVEAVRSHARPAQAPVDGVGVARSLDDALRLLAHRLSEVTVERHGDQVPAIRAHPAQLGQVWTNLITNAVEAPARTIRIMTTAPDDAHVEVAITDDGPGIPADALARVFEPRFTTKHGRVRYGLGQGLAIARRIVDLHGGTIDLHSRPGATTVRVVLPVAGPGDDEERSR